MTTDELLSMIRERGLRVELGQDGVPKIIGRKEELTPPLVRVLRWHRAEIVRRLQASPIGALR